MIELSLGGSLCAYARPLPPHNDAYLLLADPPPGNAPLGMPPELAPVPGPAGVRVARAAGFEGEADPGLGAAETPALALDKSSIVAARIAATRAYVGQDFAHESDSHVLEVANLAHLEARLNPADADAVRVSAHLLQQECEHWAAANGDPGMADAATRVEIYQELWSLAVDPPALPFFHSRDEIADQYGMSRPVNIIAGATPPYAPVTGATLDQAHRIRYFRDDPEVVRRYLAQFHAYARTELGRLAAKLALLAGQRAGLKTLALTHKPARIWEITAVDLLRVFSGAVSAAGGTPSETLRRLGPCFIFQMADGRRGCVDGGGRLRWDVPAAGTAAGVPWVVNDAEVLACYDQVSEPMPGNPMPHNDRYVISRVARHGQISLKQLLQEQARRAVTDCIAGLRAHDDGMSRTTHIAALLVPFYDTWWKSAHDPGYEVQMKDVAFDVLGTVGMLAALGVGHIGGTAVWRALVSTVEKARRHGSRAMAAAGLRLAAGAPSRAAATTRAVHELVDFAVPVATVMRVQSRQSRAVVAAVLRQTCREAAALRYPRQPAHLLNAIYTSLSETGAVGTGIPANRIRESLLRAARRPVPDVVYRGHAKAHSRNLLHRGPDAGALGTADDYLVACVTHTARTGGSNGTVLSLTADRSVATGFARRRVDGAVFAIDTTRARGSFKPIAAILLDEGPRLVQSGRITPGTLRAAIRQVFCQVESELFYLGGDIPDEFIHTMTPVFST